MRSILIMGMLSLGIISCKADKTAESEVGADGKLLNVAQGETETGEEYQDKLNKENKRTNKDMETAVFGGGCFWCVEAVFQELKGVSRVESGYSGGHVKNPSYREVTTGKTGHAEVVKITYDPEEVSYEKLLSVFFKTHDPTTLNRQGADVGPQYRSVIFYNTENQKEVAERIIEKLNQENVYPDPIVTEVSPLKNYYEAEDYHQDYYDENPNKAYCTFVIQPKLEKFRKVFSEDLKD